MLFLSARDTVGDRVRGLRLGADDYLTKPFSVVEVTVRLEGLLRRSRRQTDGGPLQTRGSGGVLRCADLDQLWQYDFAGDGNVVKWFVSNLRRKIDSDGPATADELIAAGLHDGQPHQVPDHPAMTVIRLDLTGSGSRWSMPMGRSRRPTGW